MKLWTNHHQRRTDEHEDHQGHKLSVDHEVRRNTAIRDGSGTNRCLSDSQR
jgi:hypothetical protein